MESYEENRVKWLIDKPGGLFLTRRSGTLRRAGIYPGDYYVTNQYDTYGYLTEITEKNGSSVWKAVENDAKGQLTKYSLGGNTITVGIDSRGFPTSILCPNIINVGYSFNSKGNLDYRQDNLTGYKESFIYDSMNRLKNWNIYKNNVLQKGESLSYNDLTGNIATKSDIGGYAMNYGENGKPHALTSITGVPAGLPTDNLAITYTDFKKVKSLTEGANTYTLSYGVDEQRIKSVYAVNGVTLMTRYYLGDYEEEVSSNGSTRKIYYLGDGAVYVSNNGMDSLLFTYKDYLGSLVALTDYAGSVLERYAYDPWGTRRSPTDWTQKDTRTSWRLNRGYTMHEHLDAFGIINMNGRVYDPLTAQFFSPDPYLQTPNDWLNYNRYSYALNNPMLYTDPSGEFLGIFLRALAFVGDFSSNLIQGESNSAGKAWVHSGKVVNDFSNVGQIPVYSDSHTRITAGLDPLALGVSANVTYMENGHAVSGSIGFGFGGWNANVGYSYTTSNGWNFGVGAGMGNNYWGWNASATYKGVGGGYGRTYFGGENAQILGNWSILWRGGSFNLQNDVGGKLLGIPIGGDTGDRWRTNAFELTFGDFSIGSSLFTNDGKKESIGAEGPNDDGIDYDAVAPGFLMGKNRPIDGKPAGAWKNGQVYSAPLWLSYRVGNSVSRVGFSHWRVQNATQNFVHRWVPFGRQQYYLGYKHLDSGFYGYSGYYNPFSLYNK